MCTHTNRIRPGAQAIRAGPAGPARGPLDPKGGQAGGLNNLNSAWMDQRDVYLISVPIIIKFYIPGL